MAFGNWEFYTAAGGGGPINRSLQITTPINGAGSLALGYPTTNATTASISARLDSTFNRGFTKGRIRTITRSDWELSVGGQANTGPAIFFLASVVNVDNVSGNMYFAGLHKSGTNQVRPVIAQLSSDLPRLAAFGAGQADNIADSATPFTMLEGEQVAMQVEWNVDLDNLGGTRIIFSVGNIGDTDFTNLAVVYDFVHASGPITSGVNEGLLLVWNSVNPLEPDEAQVWDSTEVRRLS